jgi:hypothetical protein
MKVRVLLLKLAMQEKNLFLSHNLTLQGLENPESWTDYAKGLGQ